ncbi:MAG: polyketide synthase dehydratase domain-containing protein [Actinomycetota bacterium]|nr:polyketide synthase dehydratase domain-containing protein [Actinomycetota bacterium]
MTASGSRPTDVAIVGMAALFPGAADLGSFWHNIVNRVDAVTDVPATRWDPSYYDPEAWSHPASDKFYCRRGGFIDDIATFDPARFGIVPVAVDATAPDQLLALKVAAAAIADAGGDDTLGDRSRCGVILGRGGYLTAAAARLDQRVRASRQLAASLRELVPGLTDEQVDQVRRDFQQRLGPERPEESIGLVPNLAASRIANRLDLNGPAYTVDAACASSLLAVDHAMAELAGGRCDVVIAGAVHVCDDVTIWSVFSALRALSPSQQIRPFDRRADGILVGEGTGMLILRRLADAERRGDRIYAVIRGSGVASDGRESSLMRPGVEGQVLALERAWAAAGLDPTARGAVGLIEAHGTATPVGDAAELTSLGRVFGADGHGAGSGSTIGIGSVKSMIGHSMPAAGMAGLIKAALAVYHRVLPPTLHCEEPHPALAGTRFQPVSEAVEWDVLGDGMPRRAAVNAFGFGGINAHVILEEPPNARATAAPAPLVSRRRGVSQRVLLLAGGSADEVNRQLAVDDAILLARDDLRSIPAGGPWRLAIVDPNQTRLELARKVAARGRPWRGRNDVWFTSSPLLVAGRVGFLFPGIEQSFEPNVDGVAEHFGLPAAGLAGVDSLGRHGVANLAVGRLLDGALRQLGIEPDDLAGHSMGEWNAMIAAGMHDAADIDRVVASFDRDSIQVPGLVFSALGCGAATAQAALAGLDRIVVSHDNCPHQSVICGEEASVAAALARLRSDGVLGQVLDFRSGFHSPMVAPYLGPLGDLVHGLPMRPARTPIWSATIADLYPQDLDQVRQLAIRHLLEPVRFGPMLRQMHDAGVRAFVQVGWGSLTGFADDALRDREQLVISACTAKNNGLDQLLRVAAALWVEGRAPEMARLAAAPGGARDAGAVTLRLGTPLIHFAQDVTPLLVAPAPAAPLAPLAQSNPLVAEFGALLADTNEAARAVLRSWQEPPAAPPPTTSRTTRVVSVETMPYLMDHCFYRQADGWPSVADQFPVVPMTTMVELMMDAARSLSGSRTVVGMTRIRALRWLAAAEPVTVTTTAAVDEEGNIDVALEGYARGKALVADGYPTAPISRAEPLPGERPSPVGATELYRDHWMFHGPAFQGVTEISAYSDDGIRGQLISLDAPGSLLDNAGQLFGLWILTTVAEDKVAFPASIEGLELFGPIPPPGQRLETIVWVRSVTATSVTADLELRQADGTVWARITGWTDHRFRTGTTGEPELRWPDRSRISEAQPGGWFLLRDRWPDPANRELVMRRYLVGSERRQYEGQNPRGRHHWLLGRIVAKDAARQWLWDRGAGPLFPGQCAIENDAVGRPSAQGLPEGTGISIAHSGELAVALVAETDAPGRGVGIDVEAVEERTPQFESLACTEAERALLDLCAAGVGSRLECLTRFWAAKEAVAKAIGTGLGGRPHRFEVTQMDRTLLLVAALDEGSRWWVDTTTVASIDGASRYVVGWTATPVPPSTTAAATTRDFSPLTLVTERTSNGR